MGILTKIIDDKEKRGFFGSAMVFLLVISILISLLFVKIPEDNRLL
jgi:hypothetical protein